MPIPVQVPIVEHVPNGVTTVFSFPFTILVGDDLKARLDGVEFTAFTISGVGDRDGGSITCTSAPTGSSLLLYREVTLDRATDYQELGDLLADVLDDDFDRVWMALQDQLVIASRTVRAPVGETIDELPDSSTRANRSLGFGEDGQPVLLSRTDDGGAAIALDLLNKTDATKGPGMIKYGNGLSYDTDSVGAYIIIRPDARTFPSLAAFFAQASGKINFLPGGTYTLTSLLDLSGVPLSDCEIIGVPGETVITGAFGYALLMLGALNNVRFHGIEFNNTYSNAAVSSNTGVVMSGATDWIDGGFTRCKFTAPNANTQGLAVFNRTVAGGSDTCVIDGLYVEDSNFASIGGIASTIYNRQESSDKYDSAKRVRFLHNRFSDLGLSGTNGFAISLDGFGSEFELDHNQVSNPLNIGIENTGWVSGSISHNTFRDLSSRNSRVVSLSDPSTGYTTWGITAIGNKCLEPAKKPAYASLMNKSFMSGNEWETTGPGNGTGEAFVFLDCSDNMVEGDSFKSDNKRAVRLTSSASDCKRNTIRAKRLDTSASGSNTAVVSFDGANVTDNYVTGRMFKGTGGAKYEQINSAASNVISDDSLATSGSYTPTLTNGTNVAASTAYACQWTRIDNDVTVFGRCDVDPTAGGSTILDISLPIPSDFIATENLSGIATAISPTVSTSAGLFADVTNDRATMRWVTTETANHSLWFHFSYKILPA